MPRLEGAGILLTRSPGDNRALSRALRSRGARVLELPCVRVAPAGGDALARAVRALTPDDRLVVTSRAGADAVLGVVRPEELRAPVSAIGPATATRLRRAGVRAEASRVPTGAALGRGLPVPAGRVLLARADRARPELADALRARGARVEEVVAYGTVAGASGDVDGVRHALGAGEVDVVVFASPSAVDGLVDAVPAFELAGARVVAIGPTTAAAARERIGMEVTVADRPTTGGLLRAIERALEEVADVARR